MSVDVKENRNGKIRNRPARLGEATVENVKNGSRGSENEHWRGVENENELGLGKMTMGEREQKEQDCRHRRGQKELNLQLLLRRFPQKQEVSAQVRVLRRRLQCESDLSNESETATPGPLILLSADYSTGGLASDMESIIPPPSRFEDVNNGDETPAPSIPLLPPGRAPPRINDDNKAGDVADAAAARVVGQDDVVCIPFYAPAPVELWGSNWIYAPGRSTSPIQGGPIVPAPAASGRRRSAWWSWDDEADPSTVRQTSVGVRIPGPEERSDSLDGRAHATPLARPAGYPPPSGRPAFGIMAQRESVDMFASSRYRFLAMLLPLTSSPFIPILVEVLALLLRCLPWMVRMAQVDAGPTHLDPIWFPRSQRGPRGNVTGASFFGVARARRRPRRNRYVEPLRRADGRGKKARRVRNAGTGGVWSATNSSKHLPQQQHQPRPRPRPQQQSRASLVLRLRLRRKLSPVQPLLTNPQGIIPNGVDISDELSPTKSRPPVSAHATVPPPPAAAVAAAATTSSKKAPKHVAAPLLPVLPENKAPVVPILGAEGDDYRPPSLTRSDASHHKSASVSHPPISGARSGLVWTTSDFLAPSRSDVVAPHVESLLWKLIRQMWAQEPFKY
ncbi:hypothetical protein DL93DRAFT_2095297 [Clavulina sp. PMI_390]|nr:hypothetical protein DL93DRAFT_2095297 [Clavulina sp. PMI_390]